MDRRERESERIRSEAARGHIGKQIVLPFSKAVEISFRGLKVRFWRSLITMSGIILAIAFLTSVWMNGAVRRALPKSPRADDEVYTTTSRTYRDPEAGMKLAGKPADPLTDGDLGAIGRFLNAQGEGTDLAEDPPAAQVRSGLLTRVFGEGVRFWRVQVRSPQRSGPAVLAVLASDAGTEVVPFAGGKGGSEKALDPILKAARLAPRSTPRERYELAAALALLAAQFIDTAQWPASFEVTEEEPEVQPTEGSTKLVFDLRVAFDERTRYTYEVEAAFAADSGALTGFKMEAEREFEIYRKVRDILTDKGLVPAVGASVDEVEAEAEHRRGRAQEIWLVALSLCVASVGIVNAMLMSVTERFREIGTMKCLGALDSFIVKLFLLESFFLGMVGAVVGIAIGLTLTLLQNLLLDYWVIRGAYLSSLPMLAILMRCGWAFLIGAVLAVVGTIYPAAVAARMEPVVAMRADA